MPRGKHTARGRTSLRSPADVAPCAVQVGASRTVEVRATDARGRSFDPSQVRTLPPPLPATWQQQHPRAPSLVVAVPLDAPHAPPPRPPPSSLHLPRPPQLLHHHWPSRGPRLRPPGQANAPGNTLVGRVPHSLPPVLLSAGQRGDAQRATGCERVWARVRVPPPRRPPLLDTARPRGRPCGETWAEGGRLGHGGWVLRVGGDGRCVWRADRRLGRCCDSVRPITRWRRWTL